jgi:hypothetical protein
MQKLEPREKERSTYFAEPGVDVDLLGSPRALGDACAVRQRDVAEDVTVA